MKPFITTGLLGLLVGCVSHPPEVIPQYEILKLERLIYVPIRKSMTAPVEVPYAPPGPVDTITENTTLAACQVRVEVCNGKLADIAKVQGTPAKKE